MYMGHYHIFFYSKANAPYFPGVGGGGVGVSIDRCITKSFPSSRRIACIHCFRINGALGKLKKLTFFPDGEA